MSNTYCEPSLDPPEEYYVYADCGHEVYKGELLREFNGKTWCPECFLDEIYSLSIEALDQLLDIDSVVVEQRNLKII